MPLRDITEEGLKFIRKWESFSPTIYICPAGYPTIGYGHVVKKGEEERFKGGITRDQSMQILHSDVMVAIRAVLRYINVTLSDPQFDALVSFTFNAGAGALQASTLRKVINRGEYEDAPEQFERWVYANGKKLRGLVNRRAEEALMFSQAEAHNQDDLESDEFPLDPAANLQTARGWLAKLSQPFQGGRSAPTAQ
jgi:GH24 family phage-related lysozyme (muramidase)